MKKLFITLFLLTIILYVSCSDATISSITSYGSSAYITCYSGGKVIYDGESTGRIATIHQSDGWEFKDKKTGEFIRVSGDCIIRN